MVKTTLKANLKAFTIAELLVVMILSSIVIITIYFCHSVVFGYFNSYRTQFSSLNSVYQFNFRMQNLCETCDYVISEDSSLHFIGPNKNATIYFSFGNIIYSEDYFPNDTLPMTQSTFKLGINKQGNFMYIGEIAISSVLFGEPLNLTYEKKYSSEQFILISQKE
ncbi:MAG: hypothetical protein IT247_09680 [Bacteroidia bacterium]|nr:hypothetical protein [Bacteroidia bacterium]